MNSNLKQDQLDKITVCFLNCTFEKQLHLRFNTSLSFSRQTLQGNVDACCLAEFWAGPHIWMQTCRTNSEPNSKLCLRRSAFAEEFDPHPLSLSPHIPPSLPSEHQTGWTLGERIGWSATLPSPHNQLQPTLLWPSGRCCYVRARKRRRGGCIHTNQCPELGPQQ